MQLRRRALSRPSVASFDPSNSFHQLLSLPTAVQQNILQLLSALHNLALASKDAHSLVYNTSVTKLSFTLDNMGYLPIGATFSGRYPAVTHLDIRFAQSTNDDWITMDAARSSHTPKAADFCYSLLRQNKQQHLQSITRLDITLEDKLLPSTRSVSNMSQLIKSCTSLKQLYLYLVVDEPPSLVLILQEQVPGQGLQHPQDLLDNGMDLAAILASQACRNNLVQLHDIGPRRDTTARHVLAGPKPFPFAIALEQAVPKLHTLHDVALNSQGSSQILPPQHDLSQLTRLELVMCAQHASTWPSFDLELPVLKELALTGYRLNSMYSTEVKVPITLQALTRLHLSDVTLLDASNTIWDLTSLRHLTLNYCRMDCTSAILSSRLCSLPQLTYLAARSLRNPELSHQHLAHGLQLHSPCKLLELELCVASTQVPTPMPTTLTSLSLSTYSDHRWTCTAEEEGDPCEEAWWDIYADFEYELEDFLPPANLLSCTHLKQLRLYASTCYEPWLPLVAQMTLLEHLEMRGPVESVASASLDVSCLDALTRLTCLKLFLPAIITPPDWPQLRQAARLKQLTLRRWDGWPSTPLPPSLSALMVVTCGSATIPQHLSSCTSLSSLVVTSGAKDACISGVEHVFALTGLQRLSLTPRVEAPATCAKAIAEQLTDLRRLVLGDVQDAEDVVCLGGLRRLSSLHVDDEVCDSLEDQFPSLRKQGLFPRLTGVSSLDD